MARLTAPLFSLDASGTLAEALTFARWKGVNYVRTRVIPANPNTANQQEVRGVFTTLSEMWKRMDSHAKEPWQKAVEGQPLTDRNKHVQLNVPALQGKANMNDLVMSVASGQAIPMEDVAWADGGDGTAVCTCTAPSAPTGYTLLDTYGLAVLDGDPSPAIERTTYFDNGAAAPWSVAVDVPEDGTYQCGLIALWQRTSDNELFYSVASRDQVAVTGN